MLNNMAGKGNVRVAELKLQQWQGIPTIRLSFVEEEQAECKDYSCAV